MADNIIFAPQVRINNVTWSLVANSTRLTSGKGESNLKPQSSGNGEVKMVYSEDVETKITKLIFSVYSTAEKFKQILELKDNRSENYITLNDVSINIVAKEAALINDPELTFGNDGQAELEFSCRPVD